MITDAAAGQFRIDWIDGKAWPQVAPDPRYPKGIDLNAVKPGERGCRVALPYPAKRIGLYYVACQLCGLSVSLTTAGRPDDPRSLAMPCKLEVEGRAQ